MNEKEKVEMEKEDENQVAEELDAQNETKEESDAGDESKDERSPEAIERELEALSIDDELVFDEDAVKKEEPIKDDPASKDEEKKEEDEEKDESDKAKEKPEEEKDEKPSNAAMARMRIEKKEAEAKLNDALERLEKLESGKTDDQQVAQQAPQKADPATMAVQVANAFMTYVNASGVDAETQFGTEGRARQVAQHAITAIRNEASVESMQTVIQQAQNRLFGDASEDIEDIATRELSVVLAREAQAQRTEQQKTVSFEQAQNEFRKELDVALDTYEALKDDKSEEYNYLPVFDKEWLGDIDPRTGRVLKAGKLPEKAVALINNSPMLHVHMAMLAHKANKSASLLTELETTKKELKALRDKYHLSRSPTDSTPSGDSSDKGVRTVKDIERQLEEMSA